MKMKIFAALLSLSLLSVSVVRAADNAVISGKVTLKGTPPPEIPIGDIANNIDCKKLHPNIPNTKRYVVGANGELANCFVWVKEGLPAGKTYPPPAQPVVLDQKNCLYEPYVFAIQVGQELKITNSDPTLHNVHALGVANSEFNNAQPAGTAAAPAIPLLKKFSKPEMMMTIKCDVHPWMFAYCSVVPHPFFAVTGADGAFKISGLPAGEYTVEVVHKKAGSQTMKVKVTEGGTATADFTLNVPAAK